MKEWNQLISQWFTGSFNIWHTELQRMASYLYSAFPQEEPQPQWATDNTTAIVTETVNLRLFGTAQKGRAPVLIVTPQVNHSYIADFSKSQTLVGTMLASGIPLVAVTDWPAPPERKSYGIADSIDDIMACMQHLGKPVNLIGLCQGGWQSAIVAALQPDDVKSLCIAAAPIDTHVGSSLLQAFVFGMPMAWYRAIVMAGGGVAPGALIASGFDLMKPVERLFYNYATLYLNAHDETFVNRYDELRNWYRLNKDIAGSLYLEVVQDLFKRNRLARGDFMIHGHSVDLTRINCPTILVAGTRDHITPREQVFSLDALTPRSQSTRFLVDAGHIGVFMGRKALKTVWPEISRQLN